MSDLHDFPNLPSSSNFFGDYRSAQVFQPLFKHLDRIFNLLDSLDNKPPQASSDIGFIRELEKKWKKDIRDLEEETNKLVRFVANLPMGKYFADELNKIVENPSKLHHQTTGVDLFMKLHKIHKEYRQHLQKSKNKIYQIIKDYLDVSQLSSSSITNTFNVRGDFVQGDKAERDIYNAHSLKQEVFYKPEDKE